MQPTNLFQSKHFELQKLAVGVFAAIHKDGGAAYSNAGMVDLGDRTLVVDAFDAIQAGRDLRKVSEELFSRPVEILALTHSHSDHWMGAAAFDDKTMMITSATIRKATLKEGKSLLKETGKRAEWTSWVDGMRKQLQNEEDARVRLGLELTIRRVSFFMEEMETFQPRYADQTFTESIFFQGSHRTAELHAYGNGHSSDDVVMLLPGEEIAFIGDLGFFKQQPFMEFCNLDRWREHLNRFLNSAFHTFVPGHGPVGYKAEINLQLDYFDVMEDLITQEIQKGNSVEKALKIHLPAPFEDWLRGSMGRFEANVRYFYKRLGEKG